MAERIRGQLPEEKMPNQIHNDPLCFPSTLHESLSFSPSLLNTVITPPDLNIDNETGTLYIQRPTAAQTPTLLRRSITTGSLPTHQVWPSTYAHARPTSLPKPTQRIAANKGNDGPPRTKGLGKMHLPL